MKLGIIALCDNEDEVLRAMAALTGKGVKATAIDSTAEEVEDGDLDDDMGEDLPMPEAADLKATLTAYKDEFGKDALVDLLEIHDATSLKTLKKDEWPAIYAEAQTRLDGDDDGLDDDDDLDDDDGLDDDDVPDRDEVKTAVQAAAKAHGKEAALECLAKAGLKSVRGIKGASDEAIIKLHKAVSRLK